MYVNNIVLIDFGVVGVVGTSSKNISVQSNPPLYYNTLIIILLLCILLPPHSS